MSDLSRKAKEIKEGGRPLVVSISGGKDSTAMGLYLIENGFHETNKLSFVYADTGWEHPEVYEYLEKVVEPLFRKYGEFHYLRNPKYPNGMVDMIRKNQSFPTRIARFCTKELKINPIKIHLKSMIKQGEDPINVVGIRAQESLRRSLMDEYDEGGPIGCDTWRPLIKFLLDDVVDIHARYGISPCSLYYKKENPVKSVGCWPCILSPKAEIKAFAEDDQGRLKVIQDLEKEIEPLVQIKAQKRAKKDGIKFDPDVVLGGTFFGASKKPYPRSIEKAIDWSKTARGGKQYELFTAQNPAERGCQMWGLCDVADEEGEFTP
tara:strand:+ start:530 stop:1489 length:960 start_codon:yes stop_codon:yes gene_type:complete